MPPFPSLKKKGMGLEKWGHNEIQLGYHGKYDSSLCGVMVVTWDVSGDSWDIYGI